MSRRNRSSHVLKEALILLLALAIIALWGYLKAKADSTYFIL